MGDDKFLWDIINELSKEYETKKITITKRKELKLVDKWMEWADICWLEWCDEIIAYGSQLPIAQSKKIICRIHRYEVLTDNPKKVNWLNVDKLVLVAGHLEVFLKALIPDIERQVDIITIANGVNLEKYQFKERKNGFNIAYIGHINYRKNPVLLLQIMKKLVDKDNRYKLYIAGKFQDVLLKVYWDYQITKMNLEDNIIFEGWQNDIGNWLEDKHYLLSTSIHESFGYGIAEAMSRGIKPIIHNFVFSQEIWDGSFLFNTLEEAVDMIRCKKYMSMEYRKFIEQNYSLEKQMTSIRYLLKNLLSNKKGVYTFKYNGIFIKFYLPMLNDYIQKSIYTSKNFYEVAMLEDIKKRIGHNGVMVDVGANIGNHTLYFSRICKARKVYAFEPQKNIFDILKTNIEINNLYGNVELFNIGLGAEQSYGSVNVINQHNYGMSKIEKHENGKVEINTLDNLLFNKQTIDLIKIDVEGMEMDVLQGSHKILKKHKPIIYVEAGTEDRFNKITMFLNKYGYKPRCKFNATPTYLYI